MNVGARMATPQPDHLLIVSSCQCIPRVPVRILVVAATITRRSLEFNPIMEAATLQHLRDLRTGMLLNMRGKNLVQKLPPTDLRTMLVTNAFDFISLPY